MNSYNVAVFKRAMKIMLKDLANNESLCLFLGIVYLVTIFSTAIVSIIAFCGWLMGTNPGPFTTFCIRYLIINLSIWLIGWFACAWSRAKEDMQ